MTIIASMEVQYITPGGTLTYDGMALFQDLIDAGGGGGGGATDLGYTAATRLLTSSTGTDVTLPLATTLLAGLMSAADKTALAAIVKGTVTVTVPNNRLEWSETVAATGITTASVIVLSIAPHDDTDENDAEMLDISAMSAAPGTDQITVELAFSAPCAGPVKLNWMAA